MAERSLLMEVYRRLEAAYDLDRWHWRADTPAFDICAGAILVQHTAWSQVEKALANLRAAEALSPEGIARLPEDDLAYFVRPSGMPLTKARRLKAFVELVDRNGSLQRLLSLPAEELRVELLATPGIGPETADVIGLYAARHLVQVHDAYSQRLMRRLGVGPDRDGYGVWTAWLSARLAPDVRLYQRYHAAIVVHCKEVCRVRPKCELCPLLELCEYGKANSVKEPGTSRQLPD